MIKSPHMTTTNNAFIIFGHHYVEKHVHTNEDYYSLIMEIINCRTINALPNKPHHLCHYEPRLNQATVILICQCYNGAISELYGCTIDTIKAFSQQIGHAVAYLHAHDILHRDIKPDNIFYVRHRDGTFDFFLGDFGSVKCGVSNTKVITEDRTTLIYRAPELFIPDTPYSEATDVWSFGVVIFTMQHDNIFDAAQFTDYKSIIAYLRSFVNFDQDRPHLRAANAYMRLDPDKRPSLVDKFQLTRASIQTDNFHEKLLKAGVEEDIAEYINSLYNVPTSDINRDKKIDPLRMAKNLIRIPPLG